MHERCQRVYDFGWMPRLCCVGMLSNPQSRRTIVYTLCLVGDSLLEFDCLGDREVIYNYRSLETIPAHSMMAVV
jgi:hypothetical protein